MSTRVSRVRPTRVRFAGRSRRVNSGRHRLCHYGFVVLLLCGACRADQGADAGAGPGTAVTPPSRDADSLAGRPYQSPPGFPIAFHTMVPGSFEADANMEGQGPSVAFTWMPRDERRDSAFVFVRVMAAGSTEAAAREIVRTAADRTRIPGDRTELKPRHVHDWAVVEYPIASVGTFGERVKGWVALGLREGRWFYLIVQAPVEVWERFASGAEVILAGWRWAGTHGGPGDKGLASPA
jgi:hypothetical protein